jgi:hypothetical protein
MKRHGGNISNFPFHFRNTVAPVYYKEKYPIDEILKLLFCDNLTNRSLILAILNSGYDVVFTFSCVIDNGSETNELVIIQKIKELILSPAPDNDEMTVTDMDYVLSKLKELFISSILSVRKLNEVHFYGFKMHKKFIENMKDKMSGNIQSPLQKKPNATLPVSGHSHLGHGLQRNFVIDMDIGDGSPYWKIVGSIKREDVRNRCCSDLDALICKYTRLIMLQIAHFANIMILSLFMNDKYYLTHMYNGVEIKDVFHDNESLNSEYQVFGQSTVDEGLEFDSSLCLLSKSIHDGTKKIDEACSVYFSGSKGIHIWFDQSKVDPSSVQRYLVSNSQTNDSLIASTRRIIEWVGGIITIIDGILVVPPKYLPVHLLHLMSMKFDLKNYCCKKVTLTLVDSNANGGLPKSTTNNNFNQNMGFLEIADMLLDRFHTHLLSFSNSRSPVTTKKWSLDDLIDVFILGRFLKDLNEKSENIDLNEEVMSDSDLLTEQVEYASTVFRVSKKSVIKMNFIKSVARAILFFNPLVVMDFGIYNTSHSIKLPGSINSKTNLTAFKIDDWTNTDSIKKCVEEKIMKEYQCI